MHTSFNLSQQPQVVVHDYWDFYNAMRHKCITDTVVTWDLSKLSKISKNRVLKWLDTGNSAYSGGEAAGAYNKVVDYAGIPKFVIPNGLSKFKSKNYYDHETIEFSNPTEDIYKKLNEIYQSQRVIYKLESRDVDYFKWWYEDENLDASKKRLIITSACDVDDLIKLVKKLLYSDEFTKRVEYAKELVSSGGEIKIAIKKGH